MGSAGSLGRGPWIVAASEVATARGPWIVAASEVAERRRKISDRLAPRLARLAQYFLLVGVVGCGRDLPGEYESRCGVRVVSETEAARTDPAAFAASFQAAEDAGLAAYAKHVLGWSEDFACPRLAGWSVAKNPRADAAGGWLEPDAGWKRVAGLAYCDYQMIYVGTEDWGRSALVHEYAHAIERCADPKHETWAARGIYAAIAEAAGELGTSSSPLLSDDAL